MVESEFGVPTSKGLEIRVNTFGGQRITHKVGEGVSVELYCFPTQSFGAGGNKPLQQLGCELFDCFVAKILVELMGFEPTTF